MFVVEAAQIIKGVSAEPWSAGTSARAEARSFVSSTDSSEELKIMINVFNQYSFRLIIQHYSFSFVNSFSNSSSDMPLGMFF